MSPQAPEVRRAVKWLEFINNPDGGWGELPHSYDDPTTKGIGPSTPSQTAWALVAPAKLWAMVLAISNLLENLCIVGFLPETVAGARCNGKILHSIENIARAAG